MGGAEKWALSKVVTRAVGRSARIALGQSSGRDWNLWYNHFRHEYPDFDEWCAARDRDPADKEKTEKS